MVLAAGSAWAQMAQTQPAQTQPAQIQTVQTQTVQTPAQPANENTDIETVILSPFVVSATSDSGYVATSSMAGTRLRTNLDEIAASISGVTKDMINDLGVHNASELLTYTLGTEVSGTAGSFSGTAVTPGSDQQDVADRNFQPIERIRGLANADNTRDFFLTSIPWDGFNTDRVDISRGPNAMLFGTGSPAGIINQSTIQAGLFKNIEDVTFEYGRFGSTRAQLDVNQVLLKGKLAVRAALKYSDDEYMQKEAYTRDKREFAAITYQPFSLTTIRTNYEEGRQDSVKPEWRPPFDNGITAWFNLGKPAYDVNAWPNQVTLTGTWNQAAAPVGAVLANPPAGGSNVNGNIITGSLGGGWGSDNPGLVFTEPNQVGIVGSPLYTGAFSGGLSGLQAVTNRGSWDHSLAGFVYSRQYQIAEHAGQVGAADYNEQEFSDPRIFDFYDHLLEGSNKPEGAKWHVYSVSVEQLLPDRNGGVELAYNRESVHNGFQNPFNWESYGIGVDVNKTLLDGSPNPNFGRPVMASDSWASDTLEDRTNKRLTAFYTFSLKNAGPVWLQKLIGTHTLTGSYSDSTDFTTTNSGRELQAGPDWVLENPNVATHLWSSSPIYTIDNGAARGVQSIVYLGNATSGNDPAGMNIQPVTVNVSIPGVNSVPAMYFVPGAVAGTGTWQQGAVSIQHGSLLDESTGGMAWNPSAQKSEITSKVLVLHSSMVDDIILPTLGYREDTLKFYTAGPDIYAPGGFSQYLAPLPSAVTSLETQDSFNWGTVVRLPNRIQSKLPDGLQPEIFYNESDNFSPTAQRTNMFGENIDPMQGKTKEYGIMVSAFDRKLSLRWTHYQTSIIGQSVDRRDAFHTLLRDGAAVALADCQRKGEGTSGNYNPDPQTGATNAVAADAFMNWYNTDPVAAELRKIYGETLGNTMDNTMMETVDSVSKGEELELTYNPLKNWRIALNASKNTVVNTNASADGFLLLKEIEPALTGLPGQVWTNAATHATWQQTAQPFVTTIENDVYGDNQAVNPELRKYHVNALTNYTFDHGPLQGFGVGGAVRWASNVLIGTGWTHSDTLGDVPDYTRLYFGPAEVEYDAWVSYRRADVFKHANCTVQLNVRNIGVDKKLIPVVAQPDGSIAQWRIAEPMTWSLSVRLDF